MAPWARRSGRLPRTRGDGPATDHARPASAPASPHTRGWTLPGPRSAHRGAGFPAHAGMDPAYPLPERPAAGLPRTRGDGPAIGSLTATRGTGFPAHAGMDPTGGRSGWVRLRLPRTRGDGPAGECVSGPGMGASPHTRGWTPAQPPPSPLPAGFPAHAGMDPYGPVAKNAGLRLPRTRGDGPR